MSGAYYPYVDKESAPLCFEFSEKKIVKTSRTGHLLIFPSWANHWTDKNLSEKRITVSFNTVRKSIVLRKFPKAVKEAEERLKNDSS